MTRALAALVVAPVLAGCGGEDRRSDPPAGRLIVHKAPADGPGFIEGSVTHLTVTAANGRNVVDGLRRPESLNEPMFAQEIPAGRYTITTVERPCAGSCDQLDAPAEGTRCTVDAEVERDRSLLVAVSLRAAADGMRAGCTTTLGR